jgi:diguanylate cyclase (GGDEF)-like protein/PAS domain S-box-containing protein
MGRLATGRGGAVPVPSRAVTADGNDATGPWALAIEGWPAGIAASLDDAIAVVGADGTLAWANDACATLLGRSVDEIIGADAFSLIHPDEIARAIDGISYAVAFPDRTAVVAYRLLRSDGSWVPVELKSSLIPGPGGTELLAMVIRDTTTRSTLSAALGSVAQGEDLEVTAGWIAKAVTSRWPFTGAGVVLLLDDEPVVVADRLDPVLVDWLRDPSATLAASPLLDPSAEATSHELPWVTALRTGELVVADIDHLPAPLAADARRLGLNACGAVPVATTGHGAAVVVAWFEEAAAANLEFAHALVEMCEILSLAAQRRHHLDQLHAAARRDSLTGLANRVGFIEELAELLAATGADSCAGLLYVDLDGFKPVNDAHGHAAGDLVLAAVAERLQTFAGDAIVARIGGDEFGLGWIVPLPDAAAILADHADRLVEAVSAPLEIVDPRSPDGRLAVAIGASVGIAITAVGVDPESLLQQADAAMYQAKADGRGRWHLRASTS